VEKEKKGAKQDGRGKRAQGKKNSEVFRRRKNRGCQLPGYLKCTGTGKIWGWKGGKQGGKFKVETG